MSYRKSNRVISQEQFSEGTSVDGLRLDKALGEFVERANNIPSADVMTRHTRQVYAWGFEPPQADSAAVVDDQPATKLPWMTAYNPTSIYGTPSPPDDYDTMGENIWRNKGFDVTVVKPEQYSSVPPETNQYVLTNTLISHRPTNLNELFVFLASDSATMYPNSFIYPTPGAGLQSPATRVTNQADYVSDIVVQAQVDNSLGINNAALSSLVVNKWDWRADAMQFAAWSPGGLVDTMIPTSLVGFPSGVLIQLSNLNVQVPANARLRISIIIPWYDTTIYDVTGCWESTPWNQQVIHCAAVMLEELV